MEKLTKLGITSLSLMALGVVAPVVVPDVFGANVVYAEEQTARTINVLDRASDANGTYLPTVDLGLSQVVNVTPETPYTVNQPEIEGWERDTVTYTKGDSSFSKTMKNGDQITYDDLFEDDEGTYGGILIYSYKQPQPSSDQPTTPTQPETPAEQPQTPPEVPVTKPETPADKPAVIHIGEQPTSPVNDTSLYYTIETQFGDPNDGVGWVVEEKPNINAGEIHEVEGLSEKSKPWTTYRIMEGTPESYTITYDDVKAGKTHFVFRLYNTKTHNPDGTLKTEEKPTTPADKPTNNQQPLKYRVYYKVSGTHENLGSKEGYVSPGENKIEYPATFPGYTPVDKRVPFNYEGVSSIVEDSDEGYTYLQKDTDGVPYGEIYYKKDKTPAEQPQTNPEVPATKPETPAEKPSDKPVQPAKPVEQPTTPEKPTEKPATKPTDTNKPVVNPADNGKPEIKPENKVEPKAEVKPTQQSGNAAANAQTPAPKAETKAPAAAAPKADKPAEKKMETLPNTGESQSTLALLGLALGVLGLQGLTYKGRHDRKR